MRQLLSTYLRVARPHQYVKNVFVWLPMFFARQLTDPAMILRNLLAFVAFCLAASAIYIVNDINDRVEDAAHPTKRFRPIASGELGVRRAFWFMAVLLALSFSISGFLLSWHFLGIIVAYVILNACYSYRLKHIAIVDVICVAAGFVLRVVAGGVASPVFVSGWIVLMTFLLALLLALGKRRDDILLWEKGHNTRRCINGYNLNATSSSMIVIAITICVAYLFYCGSHEELIRQSPHGIYFTAVWVVLGLFRYMWIALVQEKSGSPTLIFSKDNLIRISFIGWIMTFYWLMYRGR